MSFQRSAISFQQRHAVAMLLPGKLTAEC